jgi:hypothetical protein
MRDEVSPLAVAARSPENHLGQGEIAIFDAS